MVTGGRASEKLAVPTFTGEDTDDIGNSARSYLRQVEAWRRMTYLPLSQQGLVLYQNLGGKAWIAAEELSVPRLASDGGVSYLVEWINARFLDLEVARIGKAFSDFFRRLKRRQGQSIRDYNSEYDRLHARLREVGCSIPQECAAWLYIDRLQLDEAQELNLLASVGNEYNLYRLQQAAVLHDRGHRKPWENNRSRKPYTAHLTENAEDGHSDGDERDGEDGIELEDGVPEDVAVAYATYQSAKDRYRDQAKARGYQGDRPGGAPKEVPKKSDMSREDKVRLMKSRSYCGSCGKKGHWHRDPECPNYHRLKEGGAASRRLRCATTCPRRSTRSATRAACSLGSPIRPAPKPLPGPRGCSSTAMFSRRREQPHSWCAKMKPSSLGLERYITPPFTWCSASAWGLKLLR